MATLQEVKDNIAEVTASIASEKAEVAGAMTVLKTEIQALKDLLATGSNITEKQLDELMVMVDAIDVSVKDISEPVVPVL